MKWILIGAICLLALLAVGWIYEFCASQMDEKRKGPPPGKWVDIGGYRLHIQDMGLGPVTVILEAGMALPSLDWALVQPEIARFTRVVSYDRAGLGWSDASPYPRTAEQIVSELHDLLAKAKIPAPYLLVGHSMGGISMRLFAHRYPDEVLGIILVDASHEEMEQRLSPDPILGKDAKPPGFLLNFGIQRLLFKLPSTQAFFHRLFEMYPQPIAERYRSLHCTPKQLKIACKEMEQTSTSLAQLKKYPSSLGDKPLIVITAGALTFMGDQVGYPKPWIEETYETWKILQRELVALSQNSKQVFAEKSDHLIPRHQPQIIVNAVREMIAELMENG